MEAACRPARRPAPPCPLDRVAALLLDPGIPPGVIYAVVFASCVLESFFPPWPTDVIALYAGFLAGRGALHGGTVLAAAIAGTQVGVMAVFWVARRWGRALLRGRLGRLLHAERLGQLERWFARFGAPAIAISRFFPGVRALVLPAAGLARFSAWRVLCWAGLSVVVWNVLVVGLGVMAGTHLDWATQVLVRYNTVAGTVVAGGLLAGAALLLYRVRARRLERR
ncbi:MAG TPA: VTT domain-containing protein [Methylomirabilota bacterium]|nr:VTT domain-containing protein [Methylomirabilota bacterium]